jgi:hypothetical protein
MSTRSKCGIVSGTTQVPSNKSRLRNFEEMLVVSLEFCTFRLGEDAKSSF